MGSLVAVTVRKHSAQFARACASTTRMRAVPAWSRHDEIDLDGVRFHATALPSAARSTATRFQVVKSRWLVDRYINLIAEFRPERIFELGIFDGGSTALIAQLAEPTKLVAIELAPSCRALDEFIEAQGLHESVSTYYGVDQADTARVEEIRAREFGSDQLDLVIDDASHLVNETRSSFNALFPHLRPDGLYVIEDWSWAHNMMVLDAARAERRTPLSVLVLEIMLAAAHHPDVIDEVMVKKGWAVVRRGREEIDPATFDLASLYGEVGHDLMRDVVRSWPGHP